MEVLIAPAVSIVVERLANWAIEKAKFIKGVPELVKEMERELEGMKCFLIDAKNAEQNARGRDQMIHNWILEVQDIAYQAEDVIETYVLKLASSGGGGSSSSSSSSGGFKRLKTCSFDESKLRTETGKEIENIKSRIREARETLENYGVKALTAEEASKKYGDKGPLQWRQTFSHDDNDHFVGPQQDVEKLAGILNDKDHRKYNTVCIYGMGGLGKTTLAKKIYNHPDVKRRFNCFAWACISQRCDRNAVWQEILTHLASKKFTEVKEMTENQLVGELQDTLQNKKCLVVIDDIWSTYHWGLLKQAFPAGKMGGSKILLTSRHESVASFVGGYLHKPRLLDDDEAWELVKRKAFSNTNVSDNSSSHDKKVELGREMVKHCGGLPLGLVVLGGILATKAEIGEWEVVQQNASWRINRGEGIGQENNSGVTPVLELSYTELPYQLKPCFLSLGYFREDEQIGAEELYHTWIAEGMALGGDSAPRETMMQVAERYLNELAQRSMVQVKAADDIFSGKFESCTLHDSMRDLCLSLGEKENFLKRIHFSAGSESTPWESSNPIQAPRRLAINLLGTGSGDTYNKYIKERVDCENIRSLFFFDERNVENFNLEKFKLLRVHHLSGFAFHGDGKPLEAIGKMIHLRCLRFRNCQFGGATLPSSIANLKCLQILDLRGNDVVTKIPSVLWKMRSLSHLYLGKYWLGEGCRLDGLNELEELQCFYAQPNDVGDLFKLTRLRKLDATINKRRSSSLKDIINYLSSPEGNRLEHSSLHIWGDFFSSLEGLTLLEQLLKCHHLNRLFIDGVIRELPKNEYLSSNLTDLELAGSKIMVDPMPVLEKLPNLKRLDMLAAFVGSEMLCSAMGFPKLKDLALAELPHLEEWRVDEGAMPNLFYLQIFECEKLKMVPDGLRFVTTLEILEIASMPEAFIRRLQVVDGEEGDDLYKVRHVPSLGLGNLEYWFKYKN